MNCALRTGVRPCYLCDRDHSSSGRDLDAPAGTRRLNVVCASLTAGVDAISTRSPFMNQATPARPQIVPDLRFRGSGRARALPRDSPLLARSPLLRPELASTAGHDNRNDIREFLTARRERLPRKKQGCPTSAVAGG